MPLTVSHVMAECSLISGRVIIDVLSKVEAPPAFMGIRCTHENVTRPPPSPHRRLFLFAVFTDDTRLSPGQSWVSIPESLLLAIIWFMDAAHVYSSLFMTFKRAPHLTPVLHVHLCFWIDMWILYWNWSLKCWACRISSERPFRMETWRPATASAASPLHWGRIRQGENVVFSTYNYIFI